MEAYFFFAVLSGFNITKNSATPAQNSRFMMKNFTSCIVTILLVNVGLFAQPTNDECADAVVVPSIIDYCSGVGEFTTENATTSTGYGTPMQCMPAWDGDKNDVWFVFSTTPTVIDVSIDVLGGTMSQPQIAVYRGSCAAFAELICIQAAAGDKNASLDVLALDPSETYYLRINAASTGSDGTFQLCIDEFSSDIISNNTTNECSGTLYDTGGATGNYGPSELFEYSICPSEPHGCISIDVSYDIEPIFDNLSIYDGADSNAPLVVSLEGIAQNEFYSIPTEGCVTLKFISDNDMVAAGFELTWTCALNCPEPPPDFRVCSGAFYDSGGPNDGYNNNEDITTVICPDPDSTGLCSYINFTAFQIELEFDDLFIYDGPSANAPLIGVYTGTDSPEWVFSSDSCLTVVFKSDGSQVGDGWVADIICQPCGVPPPCTGTVLTCDLPDACDIACDLGTLDAPSGCPNTVPAIQSFCLNNTGATAPMPYITQAGCMDGNDMPASAADLWYSFVPSSNQININITSFLQTASVALYRGSACEELTPIACNNSDNGGVSLFANGMQPGDTYYIQISGKDENDVGEISLIIETSTDCNTPIVYTLDCGDATFTDTGGSTENYSGGENFITVICPQPDNADQCVLLNFTTFDTEANYDYLYVYDGADTNAPLIGEYSGSGSPGVLTASESCLTFLFQSDGSINRSGWTADILCANCNEAPPCLGDEPICALPNACDIACHLDTLTLPPPCPSMSSVQQIFCLNNTGASAPTPYITQTDCLSENNMPDPAANLWYSFIPSSNQLTINIESELTTAALAVYQGSACGELTPVSCNVSETGNVSIILTDIQPYQMFFIQISGADENDTGQINLELKTSTDCTLPIKQNLTCANAVFTDTGGPQSNYSGSENILTTICPDTDGCVSLEFTEFDLEFRFDYLYIYDGEDQDAPLIGEYSGSTFPGATVATGGCLSVLFQSDEGGTSPGWVANIQCIECGTIPECEGETPTCDLPDDCSDACDLGKLTPPTTCPFSMPTLQTFCVDNSNATPDPILGGQTDCDDDNDAPDTAADIWYSFIASSNQVKINVVSELNAASMGLYRGNTCGNLLPLGCNNSIHGNVSLFSVDIQPDSTYFVQISGADENDTGEIILEIESSNNCDFCVINSNLTASPPPANNAYDSGEVVTFCFNVVEWSQTASNWFHSVIPQFGPGWNVETLMPTVFPVSCDTLGVWLWQESITGTTAAETNVGTVGPGFVYDSPQGGIGMLDGNGENNYGDNCLGAEGMWQFCWQIAVKPECTSLPGSLNMEIETYGDSETGAWIEGACNDDVTYSLGQISCSGACEDFVVTSTSTLPDCTGNGGEIQINVTGGTEPYTYQWNSPDIGDISSASNLPAGTYSVTVTDADGCNSMGQIDLTSPELPISVIQVTNGNCSDVAGSITITTTGGMPPYTYSIDGGTTFQSDNTFTNLTTGTYNVVVQDSDGCRYSEQTDILGGDGPTINNAVTVNPTSCGNLDGTILIFASGGTTPYEYSNNNGVNYQNSPLFQNLGANTYNLVVRDISGCFDTLSVVLTEPEAPVIQDISSENPTCGLDNGLIEITATGGNPNYEYSIDNGTTYQSNNIFNNVAGGTYDVIVKDSIGCQATSIITLTQPGVPVLTDVQITNPSCGEDNGVINILTEGGTTPYEYSINGTDFQAAAIFTDLPSGNYTVVVRDAAGCEVEMPVELTSTGAVSITTNVTNVSCGGANADGIIDIFAEGGTAPYEYSIDNGMSYQSTSLFDNLAENTYNVVVRDANGCLATVIVDVIHEDFPPSISDVQVTDADCGAGNGSIEVIVSDVAPDIQYSIDGGTTFQDSNTFDGLNGGVYEVVIQSGEGCQDTQTVTVGSANTPQITDFIAIDPTCGEQNGSISISAESGTPPYTYSIDGGMNFQTESDFNDLAGATYSIAVMDDTGCVIVQQVTLNDAGAVLIDDIQTTNPDCGETNGEITIIANGGTMPYEYSIDNGQNTQSDNAFTGLTGATYNVLVEDANGCQAIQMIDLGAGLLVVDSLNVFSPTCGEANGMIIIFTNAMNVEYSIDGGMNFQAENVFDNLPSGMYSVVIKDADGCEITQDVEVTQTFGVVVEIISSNGSTTICKDESVDLDAGEFESYLWSTGDTGSTITVDEVGTYSVTVTDENGCTGEAQQVITEAAPSFIVDAGDDQDVQVGEEYEVTAVATGVGITYTWTGSDGSSFTGASFTTTASEEGTITYTVTAISDRCDITDEVVIRVTNEVTWEIANAFSPNDDDLNSDFGIILNSSAASVREFKIFNRWGQVVHNSNARWDGKFNGEDQVMDVYTYYIIVENFDGTTLSPITGDVLLMR